MLRNDCDEDGRDSACLMYEGEFREVQFDEIMTDREEQLHRVNSILHAM